MTIDDLKRITHNRLNFLVQRRASAEQMGDVNTVMQLDEEIVRTEETLARLQAVP